LELADGSRICVGTGAGSAWKADAKPTDEDKRLTFAFCDACASGHVHGSVTALWFRVSPADEAAPACVHFRDLSIIYPRTAVELNGSGRILAGRVQNPITGQPVADCDILCQSRSGQRVATTDAMGFFIFRDLPHCERCRLRIASNGFQTIHFVRGKTAHMIADDWHWDVFVC